MTVILIALRILVFLVVVAVALLYFFQAKLLFYPTKLATNLVFKFAIPHQEKFIAYDGEILHTLLFKASNPKARVLYFHGNGGALDTWGQVAVELVEKLNVDVLIVDYPGYGKSTGALPSTEQAMYRSGEAAFAELLKSTDGNLPLIVYGRSLGSAVASHLAAKPEVRALILETPYTSMKAMAKVVFPYVPSFLVRYNLDNEINLRQVNVPVLILHGTNDNVVPYSQGKELHSQKATSDFISIDGGSHNNLSDYPRYWDAVINFVRQISN